MFKLKLVLFLALFSLIYCQTFLRPNSMKKGVDINPKNAHCSDISGVGASWWYSWSSHPPVSCSQEFVPMIWGKNNVGDLTRLPSGSEYVLAFNEPNRSDQANLSP